MTSIDPKWLSAFDVEMRTLFGIDHVDAGLDTQALGLYCDLSPTDAAMAFGREYDLDFDDALWPRET